jgi:hypothetical protein
MTYATYMAPSVVRHGNVVRQTRGLTSGVSIDNANKARDVSETSGDSIGASTNAKGT